MLDRDMEVVKCKYCGLETLWSDPTVWYCDRCGGLFCDNCKGISSDAADRLCRECGDFE